MQVTGANLVPFTLQKQNLVLTVLGDLLAFASVFAIRLERVEQQSPFPGSEISTASLFIVVQQDDRGLFSPEVMQLCCLCGDLCFLASSSRSMLIVMTDWGNFFHCLETMTVSWL